MSPTPANSREDVREDAKRYGRLIRLKPEYREQYVALHRHPFPGILERIRSSGFRNYSIFLQDDLLFSYNEYVGDDLESDMEAMGDNSTMQDWWTLTDPMQEPLPKREEGEWWAQMDELYHGGGKTIPSRDAESKAYMSVVADGADDQVREIYGAASEALDKALRDASFQNYSVYLFGNRRFVYFEYTGQDLDEDLEEWSRTEQVRRLREELDPLHESSISDVDSSTQRSMELVFYMA